jgi:4-oxalocrotonate tautomerase
MPIVTVKVLAGAFSLEQRAALITGITEVFAQVGGEGIRPGVAVLVEEVADGMWGIGGHRLTLAEIEARRQARAAASPTADNENENGR